MHLGLERRAWTLIYVCLGVIEGGTAAVMVRSLFGQAVHGIAVDLVNRQVYWSDGSAKTSSTLSSVVLKRKSIPS